MVQPKRSDGDGSEERGATTLSVEAMLWGGKSQLQVQVERSLKMQAPFVRGMAKGPPFGLTGDHGGARLVGVVQFVASAWAERGTIVLPSRGVYRHRFCATEPVGGCGAGDRVNPGFDPTVPRPGSRPLWTRHTTVGVRGPSWRRGCEVMRAVAECVMDGMPALADRRRLGEEVWRCHQ
jgi:hypothetical protein